LFNEYRHRATALYGNKNELGMKQVRTINDIVERFRLNWQGYLRRYSIFLVLIVLAAAADMFSTIRFMLIEGPEAEGHPAVRLLANFFGPVFGPVIGKICQFAVIIAVTVYMRRWAVYIFVVVIVLYTWAAWYNIWGQNVYYPRLLKLLEYLHF
jgi:hypothetical protein